MVCCALPSIPCCVLFPSCFSVLRFACLAPMLQLVAGDIRLTCPGFGRRRYVYDVKTGKVNPVDE